MTNTEHYELEKRIAAELRAGSVSERPSLYRRAYDVIYTSVPGLRSEVLEKSAAETAKEIRLLNRFVRPGTVFLEIGPGNCGTALKISEMAGKVVAVDVTEELVRSIERPENFDFFVSDGVTLPVDAETVDVAFSNQLMEHLHPDDARQQVSNIHDCLKKGGKYICITPNRLSGPHDISRTFDETATGLHLKEYTYGEMDRLFRSAGFRRARLFVGIAPWILELPLGIIRPVEWLLDAIPVGMRKLLTFNRVASHLMGIRLIATK